MKMKFNTCPLLLVIFAVIASANPINETALHLMEKRSKCPITGTDSCCYDHGKGCDPAVANYAWGMSCDTRSEVPVGIRCDSTNVPISPIFGYDGNSHTWTWTEACGGNDGCDCCSDYNRGGKYEWANWCEPRWTSEGNNEYCFNYSGCSGSDQCCFSNAVPYVCGGNPEIGFINCFCYSNPWESCGSGIGAYCWAKCGSDAPCKNH
ncbi:8534_t:CDS:1 [Diversispora eburnea]|uniref:8534_t:CDS:1 n=1 Tax=Diversispora eburnea TaxID=1213867 RepID=A0A9N8YKT5_9GLOM|nr:8534_t:CDS:1 [Diversispora eburnea]